MHEDVMKEMLERMERNGIDTSEFDEATLDRLTDTTECAFRSLRYALRELVDSIVEPFRKLRR